jgi:4-diphosphocytidyl-2-C-methyl-D-erythritol kinase
MKEKTSPEDRTRAKMSDAAGVLTTLAPGKINLALRLVGPRPDGYHELVSVVAAVTLADELTVSGRSAPGIELACDDPGLDCGEANLIVRATRALARQVGIEPRLSIRLVKRIPVGGGMGGGSSDAACMLKALDRLWALRRSTQALSELAAQLGSDVPIFLHGEAAIVTGRGEQVQPIRWPWPGWFLLVAPDFGTVAADVYRAWSADPRRCDGDPQAVAAATHASAGELRGLLFNDLQDAACLVEPRLTELLDHVRRVTGINAVLTGSGATCFIPFDQREPAQRAAAELARDRRLRCWVVRALGTESSEQGEAHGNHRGASQTGGG